MENVNPRIVKITDISAKEMDLLNSFECGKPQINSYLKEDALEDARLGLTKTFLFFEDNLEQNPVLLGYFSLVTDRVQVISKSTVKKKMRVSGYNHVQKDFIPGIQIHHFAVSSSYQRKHIGQTLMYYVLVFIKKFLLPYVGSCLITVQSERDVVGFYNKIGFEKTGQCRDVNVAMALLTSEIYS